jgi:hypothetical protein
VTDTVDFDTRLATLTKAIQDVIKEKVPKTNLCPYTKHWWTKQLKEMQERHNQLSNCSRCHCADLTHPAHQEYKQIHKAYRKVIEDAKTKCWEDFISQAEGDDLWTAHCYLTSHPGHGGST